MNVNDFKERIDIGILTIREDEFQAVLDRLPNHKTVRGKRFYNCSRVATKVGTELSVAVTRLPHQGQIAPPSKWNWRACTRLRDTRVATVALLRFEASVTLSALNDPEIGPRTHATLRPPLRMP